MKQIDNGRHPSMYAWPQPTDALAALPAQVPAEVSGRGACEAAPGRLSARRPWAASRAARSAQSLTLTATLLVC